MTATTTASRSRRLLVPMATLLAAAAVATASGASFTSQSNNAASVYATGTLSQSNSAPNAAIFTGTNLKPGDTITGQVTITNTGTLPADFTLTETATNGFTGDLLSMTITQGGTTVYDGTFGGAGAIDLPTFAAGEARTYSYTTQLAAAATNAQQGRSASASYVWDATQTPASTFATTGSN